MVTQAVPPSATISGAGDGSTPATAPNPLREGLRLERIPEPCTMVIIGATGDLTERKLAPALYNLMLGGFLPPEFTVVGFARRDLSDDAFREHLHAAVEGYSRNRPVKPSIWASFAQSVEYHRGEFRDPAAFAELAKRLARIDRDRGTAGNRLFYLAVPPVLHPEIVRQLGAAGLAATGGGRGAGGKGWTRVIVEKPFGSDLTSARQLNSRDSTGLRRGADLPHRSLPRQGDGPEPGRLPFRQRPLRADLEPALHRLGADHRGRDGRRRGPRRVLRPDRGAARHRAEPRAAAAGGVRHGAADRVRAPDLRDEKLKVLRAVKPMTRARWPTARCAGSTRPAGSPGSRSAPIARSRRWLPIRNVRPTPP